MAPHPHRDGQIKALHYARDTFTAHRTLGKYYTSYSMEIHSNGLATGFTSTTPTLIATPS
eukprot:scaffold3436_cov32-Tisochrysis_lutea.AAC.1